MQDAETVLNIIRNRGQRGLKVERLYRQLFNEDLYLYAYSKLYANKGAMTKGSTVETVDGMSLKVISNIIDRLRDERYVWTPVRRTYIRKSDGKSKRPLGIPTWSDKLLQEVMRMLLESFYEPQFSDYSHGFRPQRGCHTALGNIVKTHKGAKWFIEGDISKCFDSLDHGVLIHTLKDKIEDNRFIRLIENLLRAGYMENWKWNNTYSGAPQGGVLSPLLSNIYLDKLDKFVEKILIPEYTCGKVRKDNPQYQHFRYKRRIAKQKEDKETYREYDKKLRTVPASDPYDDNYRRLKYVRYADDVLLSYAGSKAEAEEIKQKLSDFIGNELRLNLSDAKTLITHGRTKAARFLGYDLIVGQSDSYRDISGRRGINGYIILSMPKEKMHSFCKRYMRGNKPIHLSRRAMDSDYDIISQYQSEYRGFVQYYKYATNVHKCNELRWRMETSLLMTLADKHKTSAAKIVQKYKGQIRLQSEKTITAVHVTIKREKKKPLTAYFGGLSLQRDKTFKPAVDTIHRLRGGRTQLIERLLASKCELCDSTDDVEVHHIRAMADLHKHKRPKQEWEVNMIARKRKTLVVCRNCHMRIHHGKYDGRNGD